MPQLDFILDLQIILMKSKIKKLLDEKLRPQSKSHESISYKRIKTWHSQND